MHFFRSEVLTGLFGTSNYYLSQRIPGESLIGSVLAQDAYWSGIEGLLRALAFFFELPEFIFSGTLPFSVSFREFFVLLARRVPALLAAFDEL